MRFFAAIPVAAALVSAASVDLASRNTPLEVTLEPTGNSGIKASLTNTGATDLKLFKTGTILDDTPVEKVDVFQGGDKIPFHGLRFMIATSNNISEHAYQAIAPGQTIEKTFDVAHTHNLTAGGPFDVVAQGAFVDQLGNIVPFATNRITTNVDGSVAAAAHAKLREKRTLIQSDCTGSRLEIIRAALEDSRALAIAAQKAAGSRPDKMEEFFKSASASTVKTVQDVLGRVAEQCDSMASGSSKIYCSDVDHVCNGNLGYTQTDTNYIVFCDYFFDQAPALSSECRVQDRAGSLLHESTHLGVVKGTDDYNGYGYDFVKSLPADKNLNHADTYTHFASAIHVSC
ncbi:neutral protease [Pseudovirgaria hyperparasitica]|uniref:Neutral protease 2 n=1 Tax=Pseudovirgaria hyperparasitica TaxID=470096 RepID=A0A6A6VUY5_9PEZI|nr:neutral protease [Pseudovirgaria hyperparasitica]KAF2753596.1 neutral protease [Pseudovirgaria hyperparasitica]